MADYFWSDTHFGHALVSRLRGFESIEEHDAFLIAKMKNNVGPKDTLWLLGDVALGDRQAGLASIDSVECERKELIWGNHDAGHPMHKDSVRARAEYLEVFDSADSMGRISTNKMKILLSHFPYAGDHSSKDRSVPFRLRDEGMNLIHGHVHDQGLYRDRQINVGVERHMDGPVELGELVGGYLKWKRTGRVSTQRI